MDGRVTGSEGELSRGLFYWIGVLVAGLILVICIPMGAAQIGSSTVGGFFNDQPGEDLSNDLDRPVEQRAWAVVTWVGEREGEPPLVVWPWEDPGEVEDAGPQTVMPVPSKDALPSSGNLPDVLSALDFDSAGLESEDVGEFNLMIDVEAPLDRGAIERGDTLTIDSRLGDAAQGLLAQTPQDPEGEVEEILEWFFGQDPTEDLQDELDDGGQALGKALHAGLKAAQNQLPDRETAVVPPVGNEVSFRGLPAVQGAEYMLTLPNGDIHEIHPIESFTYFGPEAFSSAQSAGHEQGLAPDSEVSSSSSPCRQSPGTTSLDHWSYNTARAAEGYFDEARNISANWWMYNWVYSPSCDPNYSFSMNPQIGFNFRGPNDVNVDHSWPTPLQWGASMTGDMRWCPPNAFTPCPSHSAILENPSFFYFEPSNLDWEPSGVAVEGDTPRGGCHHPDWASWVVTGLGELFPNVPGFGLVQKGVEEAMCYHNWRSWSNSNGLGVKVYKSAMSFEEHTAAELNILYKEPGRTHVTLYTWADYYVGASGCEDCSWAYDDGTTRWWSQAEFRAT